MQIALIGEFEVTYQASEPALVIHHLIRGYDLVTLDAAAAQTLGELLATTQKRIRSIGGHQCIFGAGGDLTIYTPQGQRACYLNDSQAIQLARLLRTEHLAQP